MEPHAAQTEAQRELETNLVALLKCYGPMCRVRLTLHSSSAQIPATGLACDPSRSPPGADGVLWWSGAPGSSGRSALNSSPSDGCVCEGCTLKSPIAEEPERVCEE